MIFKHIFHKPVNNAFIEIKRRNHAWLNIDLAMLTKYESFQTGSKNTYLLYKSFVISLAFCIQNVWITDEYTKL